MQPYTLRHSDALIELLDVTVRRRLDDGRVWCPDRARRTIESWVVLRAEGLDRAIVQAVRLWRVAALASPGVPELFLWSHPEGLSMRGFVAALRAVPGLTAGPEIRVVAATEARAVAGAGKPVRRAAALALGEPEMNRGDIRFELPVARMPLL